MLKKAGKNLIKHQVEKLLEGKAIESRAWKIAHRIERRLSEQSEDNKKRE